MTKSRLSVLLAAAGCCLAWQTAPASATVLTFDDLGGFYEPVPDGYGGLYWVNFFTLDGTDPGNGPGYANGTRSPSNVAYNGFGGQALAYAVTSPAIFDFNGASLTAAWLDGLSIEVAGFNGGSALYSETVTVDTTGPTFFSFNFAGIDTLQFTASGGALSPFAQDFFCDLSCTHFALDDFTLNEPLSEVPEPASVLLLGTGIAALVRRRRATAKA